MPREVVAIAEPEQSENFFTLGPFRFTTLKFLELILGGIMLLGLRGPFIIPGLLLIILSLWPTKTVSIEKILLAYLTGVPKPKPSKPKGRKGVEQVERILEVREDVPLRIEGIAVDKATGASMANAKVEVLVDGELWTTTMSDENGRYVVIILGLDKGVHELKVLVNGKPEKTLKVKVI